MYKDRIKGRCFVITKTEGCTQSSMLIHAGRCTSPSKEFPVLLTHSICVTKSWQLRSIMIAIPFDKES